MDNDEDYKLMFYAAKNNNNFIDSLQEENKSNSPLKVKPTALPCPLPASLPPKPPLIEAPVHPLNIAPKVADPIIKPPVAVSVLPVIEEADTTKESI